MSRPDRRPFRVTSVVAAAAFALVASDSPRAQSAGPLEIRRSVIAAGGGDAAAGAPHVTTTIGQADAAWSTAGALQVRGGFWGARAVPPPTDVLFRDSFE